VQLTRADLDRATRVVRDHVPVTPAYRWPLLEQATGTETWVKHENQTPTGAFKVRGGLVYADQLARSGRAVAGLVSATRGNHGQSLAYAGRAHGLPVTIVVPEGNSPDKNDAMRAWGAELVVHGRDYQESREHAGRLAEERSLEMVPPFHPELVAGVATYAAELHDQASGLDVVYVPVGMGSGICANILVRDLLGAGTEIVGVVAERANATALSFAAGQVVTTPSADTFVDGVACRTPDPAAVRILVGGAARIIEVSDAATLEAMRVLWQTTHQMPEPSGAIALAGLLAERDRVAGARVAVVLTGGNCDAGLVRQVVEPTGVGPRS
jgi:threonine dehydratase